MAFIKAIQNLFGSEKNETNVEQTTEIKAEENMTSDQQAAKEELQAGAAEEELQARAATEEEQAEPKPETEPDEKQATGKMEIHNLIIVDESGSMSHLRNATLSGINETLNTIRQAQKDYAENQQHFLTLVTFDSRGPKDAAVRTLIDDAPIDTVGEFTNYNPCGCTPLYDAMGQSLTKLRNKIRGIEDAVGVVTVLTDGLENASREWRASSLRKLIIELKESGWTFSYMGSAHDVKEVTDLLSIDNVVEFSHDARGASSTWRRENSSKMAFFGKMSNEYFADETLDLKMARRRRYNQEYYSPRVTPDVVDRLEPNEIFVFGSNGLGRHDGGAAQAAVRRFGAVMGQAEGLQGHSYAIPTTEGLEAMREAVRRFCDFARQHPELRFLVTRVGCGNAGYRVDEVANLFLEAVNLENVALPEEFWIALGLKMNL